MAVTRFWVGGTNSFGNTSAWSTSSGGGSGASVPGATDTAIIDALSGGGTYTINGSPTVLSFSCVNVNKTDTLSLSGGLTIAAGGTLSLTGNSVTNRLSIKSSVLGTQRSISVPSGATVTTTNFDTQDINYTGTFSTGATASSIGDALGNTFGWSSVQPDPSVSPSLTGTGTINWSTAAVWSTGKVPLPQDDISLGSSSTATTLTADMPRLGRNIDSSGYLKTLSFASTPNTIYGNITLGASATYSGTQALTLAGRGAQTITSSGKTFPQSLIVTAFRGSYTQQDNFADTSNVTLSNGTWLDGGFTLSALTFQSAGVATRALNCSGTWSITNASGTPWNVIATLTITNPPTIKFTGNNATTATFAGAGLTYGTLNWSSTASTGTLIITGANTFAALQSDYTTARTWQFPASTVTTVKPGGFQIAGKPGTQNITLNSSTGGTQATISMPWCGAQGGNVNYLTLKDINMTGGAEWFVGAASASTSNNTGMKFKQRGSGRYGSREIAA